MRVLGEARIIRASVIIVAVVAVLFVTTAKAAGQEVPAFHVTGLSFYYFTGENVGCKFRVNRDIIVTGLGVWDLFQNGLAFSHEVGLWDVNSGTLLRSATVPQGTVSPLVGQYRYQAIEPLALAPGNDYVVSGYFPGGPSDAQPESQTLSTQDIVHGDNLLSFGSQFQMPTQTTTDLLGGAANFLYVVPEPSTFGLVFGATALTILSVRRTRPTA